MHSRPTTATVLGHPVARGPALLGALLLLLLMLSGCGITAKVTDIIDRQDSGLRKRVAVAPFTSGVAGLDDRAAAWRLVIAKTLEQQGGVVLVDFADLQARMERLPASAATAEDRAVEAGRPMGLNTVLAGNISDLSVQRMLKGVYGFRDNAPFLSLEVEMRLLDITTGVVLGQESFKRQEPITDVLADGLGGGAKPDPKLVDKLLADVSKETADWVARQVAAQPWGGTVLTVQGNRVQVSVGRDTGLPLGATLYVYALGERIKCGTGQEICLPGPLVGKIRLSEFGNRTSWAEIVERAKPPGKDPKAAVPAFAVGQYVRTR